MIVYHHNDLDGKSAGMLVHKLKPKTIIDYPENYHMVDYEHPLNVHTNHDDVFIVDLSFTETTYEKLLNICKTARTVTWIDHHDSSKQVVEKHKEELQSIANLTYFVSTAACGAALTYAFFQIPTDVLTKIRKTSPDEEYNISAEYRYHTGAKAQLLVMCSKSNKKDRTDTIWHDYVIELPQWLFHLDDFDAWKKIHPMTDFFKYGMEKNNTALARYSKRTESKYFNDEFWNKLFGTDTMKTCNIFIYEGKIIAAYEEAEMFRNLPKSFEWEFAGTKFICLNTTKLSSKSFGPKLKDYEAAIAFCYNGKNGKWQYSVYSDKEYYDFHCGDFCSKYFGGGGHPGAAGFNTVKLIFTDPNVGKPVTKKDMIFLGGTCNDDPWRTEFIAAWKKLIATEEYSEFKHYELFNPVVDDWTPECQAKEEEAKENAKINLFAITPAMTGVFSIAEAVECSHNSSCTTIFAVLDNREGGFINSQRKSLMATGSLIERNKGKFVYISRDQYVNALAEYVLKVLKGSI